MFIINRRLVVLDAGYVAFVIACPHQATKVAENSNKLLPKL